MPKLLLSTDLRDDLIGKRARFLYCVWSYDYKELTGKLTKCRGEISGYSLEFDRLLINRKTHELAMDVPITRNFNLLEILD